MQPKRITPPNKMSEQSKDPSQLDPAGTRERVIQTYRYRDAEAAKVSKIQYVGYRTDITFLANFCDACLH